MLFYKKAVKAQWPKVTQVGKRGAELQMQSVWLQNQALTTMHTAFVPPKLRELIRLIKPG